MKKLESALGVSREEFKRLKTMIKNMIFEGLAPEHIDLEQLINAVDILADDRFQPKVEPIVEIGDGDSVGFVSSLFVKIKLLKFLAFLKCLILFVFS